MALYWNLRENIKNITIILSQTWWSIDRSFNLGFLGKENGVVS
jgi:hypothetical protein